MSNDALYNSVHNYTKYKIVKILTDKAINKISFFFLLNIVKHFSHYF